MELCLSLFGRHQRSLQELREDARAWGFAGVQAVPGDLPSDLPAGGVEGDYRYLPDSVLTPAGEEFSDRVTRLQPGLLQGWCADLASRQVQGLVLEPGLLDAEALVARGDKLLADLQTHGPSAVTAEASESLRLEVEAYGEQALEHLARACHALRQHAPGLKLALAIQDHPAAVLNPSRLQLLFEEGGVPGIGYWHDTGRAQTRAALGLDQPGDWLDRFAPLTVGSTLQDWAEGQDRRLPGEGEVDFQLVAEYLPRQAARVLAAAPVYPKELLPAAHDALVAAGLH